MAINDPLIPGVVLVSPQGQQVNYIRREKISKSGFGVHVYMS